MWASSYAWIKQSSKFNSFSIIVSGTMLALARPTGPIYLLITAFLVFFSTPPSESFKSFAKRSKFVMLILGTSTLLAAVWQLFIYSYNLDKSYVEKDLPNLFEIAEQSLNDLTRKIAESIGNFGWLDTPAPTIVTWCFVFFSATAVFRTWQTMNFRHRTAISVLPLIIISIMVYLNWSTQKYGGNFGVQGRHLTPLIVGIPILGGLNWSPSVSAKKLILVTWSGCIFVSGLIALRRYSVGVKQFNFFEMFTKPVWTPPLGIAGSIFALAIALLALSVTLFLTANKEVEQAG